LLRREIVADLLTAVAIARRSCLADDDTVAAWGDEFAIICIQNKGLATRDHSTRRTTRIGSTG
jgi:GGDEF domain-containing protein